MAKTSFDFPFNNNLGDMSIYKLRGVNKLIIRGKGGANDRKIKTAPEFETVRLGNNEFGGCAKAGSKIYKCLRPIKHLADHHFMGGIQKICTTIRDMDTAHFLGQRSILFSQHSQIMPGYSLNKEITFDSVIKYSPALTISRANLRATLSFPGLYPKINMTNPWNQHYFRFVSLLGIVPDMIHTPEGYKPANEAVTCNSVKDVSEWFFTANVCPERIVSLIFGADSFLDANGSLIVSVGIEFGNVGYNGLIKPVKLIGCGKILGVG